MNTVDRLTKRRGARAVVSDVTFRCEPGTVTGFLGPNGAGKTTTMRMLVGLIGLRDAQTGEARAMRIRQLATPSWLSTRPKPVVERRAAPVPLRARPSSGQRHRLEPATAAGSCRFSRLRSVPAPT